MDEKISVGKLERCLRPVDPTKPFAPLASVLAGDAALKALPTLLQLLRVAKDEHDHGQCNRSYDEMERLLAAFDFE